MVQRVHIIHTIEHCTDDIHTIQCCGGSVGATWITCCSSLRISKHCCNQCTCCHCKSIGHLILDAQGLVRQSEATTPAHAEGACISRTHDGIDILKCLLGQHHACGCHGHILTDVLAKVVCTIDGYDSCVGCGRSDLDHTS